LDKHYVNHVALQKCFTKVKNINPELLLVKKLNDDFWPHRMSLCAATEFKNGFLARVTFSQMCIIKEGNSSMSWLLPSLQ
jgi:hypothetical protein